MIDFFNTTMTSHLVELPLAVDRGIRLFFKREDALHPEVSGNKLRKLKYNLLDAISANQSTVLTFGGAHSNHIAATAAAGALLGLQTIGVIRGEELFETAKHSPTLRFARAKGMRFYFVSREHYRTKYTPKFIAALQTKFGPFYMIPEGGTNLLGAKGCTEILTEADAHFDIICSAVGTGGTLAGLVNGSKAHQKVLGFSALKGAFQIEEVRKYTSKTNVTITDAYCFGGYGKTTPKLITFMNLFLKETGILLDPIYTSKMMFGIYDMIEKGKIKNNTNILAIHTGGLQGIEGMNALLKTKNQLLIHTK